MPSWFAEDAARASPGARLAILDGGGHMFPETRTAEFLGIVLPFLG
jgi:pimeloyl-ACP methyl ester carboxylesterase